MKARRFFCLTLIILFVACARASAETAPIEEPGDITARCRFTSNAPVSVKALHDNIFYANAWTASRKTDTFTITVPSDVQAGAFQIEWSVVPASFTATCKNARGEVVSVITQENREGVFSMFAQVDPTTKTIDFAFPDKNAAICEARVYEYSKLPENPHIWQALPDKVDLMVISAHQDDELIFFGGTIPYYCAKGKTVAVVYMANCGRTRYNEALNGLWICGEVYHPLFLNFKDERVPDLRQTMRLWGQGNAMKKLLEAIRKYKPEVIVTHDENGEYGHFQHIVTSFLVAEAVKAAGDPTRQPESAEQYGVWNVKKLYFHLGKENTVTMPWNEPLAEAGGKTALMIAAEAYQAHVSQRHLYQMENQGVKYDNTCFSLICSTVGEDTEKRDFFENIE